MDKRKPAGQGGHAKEHHASKFRRKPPRNQEIDAAIVAFAPTPHARLRHAKAKLARAILEHDRAEHDRWIAEVRRLLNGVER